MVFPFEVKLSRTIKEKIEPGQINGLLDLVKGMLYDKDAEGLFKDTHCVRFRNRVLSLGPSWTLFAGIDSGFVELKQTKNNYSKITYCIRIITAWIIGLIGITILFISSNFELFIVLLFFGGFIFFWLIGLLRHLLFLATLKQNILRKLIEEKNESSSEDHIKNNH